MKEMGHAEEMGEDMKGPYVEEMGEDMGEDMREDEPTEVAERLARVTAMIHREDMRHKCYAAAMSRWWGVPAAHFERPRGALPKVELPKRGYKYKSAAENGGVKSLIETCLDALDISYEMVGEDLLPSKRMRDAEIVCPTAYEHNNMLCIVRPSKQQRVVFC